MSYRNPSFAWLHAARDAGSSAITLTTGTADADTPKSRLVDGMGRYPYSVTPDTGVITIDVNRGAAGLEAVDRLILLAGHSIGGDTLTVQSDDNSGFSSATTLFGPTALSAGTGQQEITLTSSTEQYLRFTLTGLSASERDIGELWFTRQRTIDTSTDQGPRPDFRIDETSQVTRVRGRSGYTSTVERGDTLWVVSLGWEGLDATNTATMRELRTDIGGTRDPFFIWPPDDGPVDLVLVELDEDILATQRHPMPGTELRYSFQINATEKLV